MGFYKFIEHHYGENTMHLFKRYNNVNNQLNKRTLDKMFLIRCRRDKISPKFIQNRTKHLFQAPIGEHYKTCTRNIINVTNKKILNMEIRIVIDSCKSKKKYLFWLKQSMYRSAPINVVNEFINNQKLSGTYIKRNATISLGEKYDKLLKENSLNIMVDKKWFINLTDKEIPSDVKSILALGNKFAVPHKKKEIPIFDVVADIEAVTRAMEDEKIHNTVRSKAATVVFNHINSTDSCITRQKLILQRMYETTKKFLKENNDLMIIGADKSEVSIAISKLDYDNKMQAHFSDKNSFRMFTYDPTNRLQDKNNRIVRGLFKDKHIDKRIKRNLMIFTAQPPRPYGTIKLHKQDKPLRIITNGTNSTSYNMAKYINEICKKAIPCTKFNISNSFELKEKLTGLQLCQSEIMVSFDIVSMFTTIPIDMVYTAVKRRWQQISTVTTIPWDTFEQMLKFCLVETNYVQWKGCTYMQIDGLTIGGCTSAIMADFVITDLLEQVISECGYDPLLCVKYVDDILIMMPKEEVENTFNILNSVHPAIKFTYELEENDSIPYLDLKIIRNHDGTISTDFYRKPTSSGRLLNYKSSHPMIQKTSMAYGFISRVLTLSSTKYHERNIKDIYTMLGKNGYNNKLINKLLRKFLTTRKLGAQKKSDTTSQKYVGIGYVHHMSENLNRLYTKYDKKLKIGYKPLKKLGNITRNSGNKIPAMEKHNVVYSIQCKDCDGTYIGQTGQKLKSRIKQHKADSKAKHIKNNCTGLTQHTLNTGHTFDFDQTEILDTQHKLSKRLIVETLYINQFREKSVNLKSDIDDMNPVYMQILSNS